MKKTFAALALAGATALPAAAQEAVTYTTSDSFEDVIFSLEAAIQGQGLVIDSVSHTGDMLERTREATGSDVVLFEHADIYGFCSASLSRKVMEADFRNVQFCPYHIFVYVRPEAPDETVVGYRGFPEGPMKEVEALLDEIAREAVEGF